MTPAAPPPLSIAVVGVGAIGSTFANQLARAGHDVTVIARPGSVRLQQLRRDQGIVCKSGERTEMRIADGLDEQHGYDLVVVTTLAHQVDAVLPALQRSQARCVHFMFNTFDPERLQGAIGDGRCTLGMPFIAATLDDKGRLHSTISAARKTLHGDRRWVELFAGAGLPSAFEADMPLWLRCHVPLCIAMESISVAGQRRGGGASWADAMAVAHGVHGAFAIIRGSGYRLHPPAKAAINAAPALLLAGMLWLASRIAAFRDLLATGVNECRALIDLVAAAGLETKPALPAAVEAVRAMKPT
jgi:2-dehydropantoate 2-reductase